MAIIPPLSVEAVTGISAAASIIGAFAGVLSAHLTYRGVCIAYQAYAVTTPENTSHPTKWEKGLRKEICAFVLLAATSLALLTILLTAPAAPVLPPPAPPYPAPSHVEPPHPAPPQSMVQAPSSDDIYVTARDTPLLAAPEPHGTILETITSGQRVTATQEGQGDPDWLHVQETDDHGALVTGYVNRQDVAPQRTVNWAPE